MRHPFGVLFCDGDIFYNHVCPSGLKRLVLIACTKSRRDEMTIELLKRRTQTPKEWHKTGADLFIRLFCLPRNNFITING